MGETKPVITDLDLEYEGLFDARELYKHVDEWIKERGYDKVETLSKEFVKPSGKFIQLDLAPSKAINDYVKYEIGLSIVMRDVTEVDIEKDGIKHRMNKGKVEISFEGVLVTDYEGKWEEKPFFFFIRIAIDKYTRKIYASDWENGLKKDVQDLHTSIKSFLNLYRY